MGSLVSPIWAESSAWLDMFALGLPVVEKIMRPALVYLFLVIGLRVFGKRELAQLNPFDIVVLLSLANTVQNAIIGDDNSVTGGVIGAFTLLTVNYLVVRFLFGHRRLDQMLQGTATVLIESGRIIPKALAKELITESELLMVLHRQGFATIDDVARCALEPGGTFSVEGRKPRETERRHDELLSRIDALGRQIAALQGQLAAQ
jgi:uncharacterized membrane protein YcaP (DUF421 family)